MNTDEHFINTKTLEILGSLSKIYKTTIAEIRQKVIHPEDVENVAKAYTFLNQNPDALHINFRRALTASNEYKWFFSVLGVIEKQDQTPIRFLGVGAEIPADLSYDPAISEMLKQSGIAITEDHLDTLFGKETTAAILQLSTEKIVGDEDLNEETAIVTEKSNLPQGAYLEKVYKYFLPTT